MNGFLQMNINRFKLICIGCALCIVFLNVDSAMHFIYSHKHNTNSAEDYSNII